MIQLDLIDEVELKGDPSKVAYTLSQTLHFFEFAGVIVGGLARESVIARPEIWIEVKPGLRPIHIRAFRKYLPQAIAIFGEIQARVERGNDRALRFAKACGFEPAFERDDLIFLVAR